MADYTVTDFDGFVMLKNHIAPPGEHRSYDTFAGKVSILEGKAMLGFDVKDESNWIARVESADAERSINFPGCQVRAVLQGSFGGSDWVYQV